MAQLREAYVVDYLRSAFSRSRPREPDRDVFNSLRMDDVAAMLVKELVKRNKINPEEINNVIVGTAMHFGEQMLMGGRNIVFLAELPVTVPARGIDRQCASTIEAANEGAMEIMLGYSDIVITAGIEHMTHNPMGGEGLPPGIIKFNPLLYGDPRYAHYDMMNSAMGPTAEKVARTRGFSREEMDKWALRSHQLATKALQEGYFKGEIMPIEVTLADGKKAIIDSDQSIRPTTTLEGLAQLPPAFSQDGLITAGNSSPLNAGATSLVLMSAEAMKKYGLKPMAKFVSFGWSGVHPTVMGEGPVPATRMALKHAGLQVKDIDYWEINEAFCVVPLYAIRELGIDPNKVNIKGGATAIGHPLGATGNRLIGTLARILNLQKGHFGVATACVGGGQGATTILERVN
jgi:acetyl-CoA C-acetyltransferase